ncbi:class I SAM-dependent RNA methyltransferase [Fulvimarina sp. 2208YS6-2-32]|uniref:Class I SAM-dependent RNA methyltransferase n=1 Tax=Fulvimarina uroteuthidis TaxID=3098149 RepID=A0ABU5HZK6_9HYPH|nr:class I SAM-dependent RNA methyltransferase [Fulvimarina sp. 2208YS6-2-32]MDY8108556.1 class I SAM-dependent RNA methyltransferase [Fulvimarina sp. 2208YS6-2-32]
MTRDVTIDRLGAQGDGIVETGRAPLFVPFTLPGESVRADLFDGEKRGTPLEILKASPERVTPPCPHFGACGGCELQHASPAFYAEFKRAIVVEALSRHGIETEVAPLVPCAPGTRRRVTLTAVRADPKVLIGFHEAHSDRIVPIGPCPVAMPGIVEALPSLEKLALLLIDRKKPLKLTVTQTAAGLDIAAHDAAKLNEERQRQAVQHALSAGYARLSSQGEILVQARKPHVFFGDIAVEPPSGGFLQAVTAAEDAMADLVMAHLAKSKRVADLFAGSGAFALRLARKARVHAVESEADALAALDGASRLAQGLKPLTMERRDLYRRPLTFKELKAYDGVVFDPPRAGAEAVCEALAKSVVKRVAAVSCNPQTLARDLRTLIDGGYTLLSVTPIDQFLWSHHVEAVALLERQR